MNDTVTITHNGKVYDIPKALEQKFISSHPGANMMQPEVSMMQHVENPFISSLTGFNTAMGELPAGILQLLAPKFAKRGHDIQQNWYEQSKQANPLSAMGGYGAGTITKYSPFATFAGPAGFMGRTALGGGIGALMGALEYPEPEQSRLGNALSGGIGGMIGANIFPAAKATPKAALDIPKYLSKQYGKYFGEKPAKQLAHEIAFEDLKNLKSEGHKLYNQIFNKAEESGITKGELKELDLLPDVKELFKSKIASKKELSKVPEAITTKNLRTIQKAKSDLDSFIREMSARKKKEGLVEIEKDSLNAAKRLRNEFEDSLKNAFSKSGGEKVVKAYEHANKHWVKVLKNEQNTLLNQYRAGDLTEEDLLQSLFKDKKTKKHFKEYFPERRKEIEQHIENPERREKIKEFLKKGINPIVKGLGYGTGLGAAYKIFKD